jgi:hypothetical protein
VAVLWLGLYGTGFVLSLQRNQRLAPDYALSQLPFILKGHYNLTDLGHVMLGSLIFSLVAALVGLFYFARRDV